MSALTVVTKEEPPRFKLQARMLACWPNEILEEQLQGSPLSIAAFAREAECALRVLHDVVLRLRLLLTAATGRNDLPADQVRRCVEDVLSELSNGDAIPWYIKATGEAFRNAEVLPALPARKKRRGL